MQYLSLVISVDSVPNAVLFCLFYTSVIIIKYWRVVLAQRVAVARFYLDSYIM